MSTSVESILQEASRLSAAERAAVAEGLLHSLDKPDPEIDQLWAKEAEARIDAADRGEMEHVSEEQVFSKYPAP